MKLDIVEATDEHILAMEQGIRDLDKQEIWAATHLPVDKALLDSNHPDYGEWSESFTALIDGEVMAMFGVVCVHTGGPNGNIGMPWLIGTQALNRYPVTFVKTSKWVLEQLQETYQYLGNFVDCRYGGAMDWLELLGFELHNPEPVGPGGELFSRFEWRAN